jgi:hypothetical protein
VDATATHDIRSRVDKVADSILEGDEFDEAERWVIKLKK